MQRQTIRDINQLRGKRVLIRADFNVPLNEDGKITDDARIAKSLETICYALKQKAKVILMSHLGRPKGSPEPKYSLRPVALRLSELLHQTVPLLPDCVGPEVEKRLRALKEGDAALLENLRFHTEEEKNDDAFSKQLASLGDIYVNDAFGSAHRAHASTVGVTKYLPGVAGFLLAKEIEYFEKALTNPDRPFVTILGGAKVSDKIKLISNLLDKADAILIGGAMAYTFCKIQGVSVGNSKLDKEGETAAREALAKSKSKKIPIFLPTDHVIAQKLEAGVPTKIVMGNIPEGWMGLDIGPETIKKFKEVLSRAKTVIWNGPVGVFEVTPFDRGTREVAKIVAGLKATTVIGGGDTAAAIATFGLEDKMSHVSTGGGASLEYLEGTVLPGVAALTEKKPSAVSQQPSAKFKNAFI